MRGTMGGKRSGIEKNIGYLLKVIRNGKLPEPGTIIEVQTTCQKSTIKKNKIQQKQVVVTYKKHGMATMAIYSLK